MKTFTFLALLLLTPLLAEATITECINAEGHIIYTNLGLCPQGYKVKGTQAEVGPRSGAWLGDLDPFLKSAIEIYIAIGYSKLEAIEMVQCDLDYSDTIKNAQCKKLVR
jgi:hypothetical protein